MNNIYVPLCLLCCVRGIRDLSGASATVLTVRPSAFASRGRESAIVVDTRIWDTGFVRTVRLI